jgi:hypothetical protein
MNKIPDNAVKKTFIIVHVPIDHSKTAHIFIPIKYGIVKMIDFGAVSIKNKDIEIKGDIKLYYRSIPATYLVNFLKANFGDDYFTKYKLFNPIIPDNDIILMFSSLFKNVKRKEDKSKYDQMSNEIIKEVFTNPQTGDLRTDMLSYYKSTNMIKEILSKQLIKYNYVITNNDASSSVVFNSKLTDLYKKFDFYNIDFTRTIDFSKLDLKSISNPLFDGASNSLTDPINAFTDAQNKYTNNSTINAFGILNFDTTKNISITNLEAKLSTL